jgi:hypothetical protein
MANNDDSKPDAPAPQPDPTPAAGPSPATSPAAKPALPPSPVSGATGVAADDASVGVTASDTTASVDERTLSEDELKKPEIPDVPEVDPESCVALSTSEAIERLKLGEPLRRIKLTEFDLRGQVFDKPVQIEDCRIDRANLQRAVFNAPVSFAGSTFINDALLGDAFDGWKMSRSWDVKLGARFRSSVSFERCRFHGRLLGAGAQFDGPVSFRPAIFTRTVGFPGARFMDKLHMVRVKAEQPVAFFETEFRGELTDLSSSVFEGGLSMTRAIAHSRLSFWGTHIGGIARFHLLQAPGETLFTRTHFAGKTLDLSKAVFGRPLQLRSSKIDAMMDLHMVEAPQILIWQHQIEGHLKSVSEKRWAAARNDYGALRIVFEQNHDYRAMDWAYYRFCQMRRASRKGPKWLKGLEWFVLDIGAGYGTKPMNIGILMALVVFVFTFVHWGFGDSFMYNVESDAIQQVTGSAARPEFGLGTALYYSVATFTTMGVGDWVPSHSGLAKIMVITEAFIGLLLMALFVAMLTRKVIR